MRPQLSSALMPIVMMTIAASVEFRAGGQPAVDQAAEAGDRVSTGGVA